MLAELFEEAGVRGLKVPILWAQLCCTRPDATESIRESFCVGLDLREHSSNEHERADPELLGGS